MHIGLITSGNENLVLFRLLHRLNFSVTVRQDDLFWPYGDKPFTDVVARIEDGILFLQKQGVKKIILSPIYELFFLQQKKYADDIVPLFTSYLLDSCCSHSLVGKLWFFGSWSDVQEGTLYVEELLQRYIVSATQKHVRNFHVPFACWRKDVSMRTYFLRLFAPRNYLVTHVLKTDMRYFKDANVDTIIPLQYSFFSYERVFLSFFNQKKIKFHGWDTLEKTLRQIFCTPVASISVWDDENNHKIDVFYTWSGHLLTTEKKWLWLLSAGKKRDLKREKASVL